MSIGSVPTPAAGTSPLDVVSSNTSLNMTGATTLSSPSTSTSKASCSTAGPASIQQQLYTKPQTLSSVSAFDSAPTPSSPPATPESENSRPPTTDVTNTTSNISTPNNNAKQNSISSSGSSSSPDAGLLAPVSSVSSRESTPSTTSNSNIKSLLPTAVARSSSEHKNYCYRHHPDVTCNRQADEKKMQELQEEMDRIQDPTEKEAINQIWATFSAAPSRQRMLILQGILAQCCFPQLSTVSQLVKDLIRIDFLSALPTELSFQILSYLDSASLCRAAAVSKHWKTLADDDVVWHRMCEQHIDKKCTKCGWGLPLLEKKRLQDAKRAIQARAAGRSKDSSTSGTGSLTPVLTTSNKRPLESDDSRTPSASPAPNSSSNGLSVVPSKKRKTRPWKDVYSERYKIERNWRDNRYQLKEYKDTSAVLSLQFDDQYLMTGTYDGDIKVWDVESGDLIRTLSGHLQAVSGLKFDQTKLISGSWDRTVRVWNYRTGECVSTFRGHEQQVLCIDFHDKWIASGSADCNVKVWNFEEKSCFTLRGHKEWVHSVKIHSASSTLYSSSEDITVRMWDLTTKQCLKVFGGPDNTPIGHVAQIQQVIPLTLDHLEGQPERRRSVVTSSNSNNSNDTVGSSTNPAGTAPINVNTNVSSTSAIDNQVHGNNTDENAGDDRADATGATTVAGTNRSSSFSTNNTVTTAIPGRLLTTSLTNSNTGFSANDSQTNIKNRPTHLLTSSLDNTIKLWDIETGECVRTLFGHAEGVWCIAADTFRIVSGAHDKLVKIWDLQSGKCWHTFSGHSRPVCCVGLSDTRFASGGDDGVVRIYCFDDIEANQP
ncbi:Met30p [Sugiyamaella lignohabitans]|uniref:Met30p n=1 Tax=Sugiyamaella lignohabitans TaxID=796027 RepID=A0A167CRX6_9ASCO|nr:Met30p [Sugiyamaella lignohabitans]ANB12036.1 Met30p [Sugiyamaella lignohabitans]